MAIISMYGFVYDKNNDIVRTTHSNIVYIDHSGSNHSVF